MALRDDVNAALAELGQQVKFQVTPLNAQGLSRLIIQVPPMLHALRDNELLIDVQLSMQGDRFALFTPVAAFTSAPSQEVLEALLRRQFVGGQSAGLSYALRTMDERYDALIVMAHWILGSITPQQFQQFYQRFMAATFLILDDVHEIAQVTPNLETVHPGRS